MEAVSACTFAHIVLPPAAIGTIGTRTRVLAANAVWSQSPQKSHTRVCRSETADSNPWWGRARRILGDADSLVFAAVRDQVVLARKRVDRLEIHVRKVWIQRRTPLGIF